MRKGLIVAIALLALPGLALANKVDVVSGGMSSIVTDGASPIPIDVILSDTAPGALDGVQYSFTVDGGVNDGLLDITTYTIGTLFLAGDAIGVISAGMVALPSYTLMPVAPLPVGNYVVSATIDPGFGNGVTPVGGFDPASVPLTIIVPEPASILLLLGALPFIRRRR